MATKRQHFVPRVYIKAWETTVETNKEPDKKFKGVYVFENSDVGEGANRDSILWKPHLYTINFRYAYICKSCPKVKTEFVNKIFELLQTGYNQPVYGKYGYSVIKTKKSIEKHFNELDNWKFYYADGNDARKTAIINRIEGFNSYILEDAFDDYFEKNWENIYTKFINSVHTGTPIDFGRSERRIPIDVAYEMLAAFFIMLCRNPVFDAMGIYKIIKDDILYPVFIELYSRMSDGEAEPDEFVEVEGTEKDVEQASCCAESYITGIWFSELYKMFFKQKGGFFHNVINTALKGCQMILFEAYEGEGEFITSDNPAFEYKSVVEVKNSTGMIFPLSPKYLIFIAKGEDGIDVVDYRYANADTIRHFNNIIAKCKTEILIASNKYLDKLI